jgi:hypothetical protein
VNISKPFEVQIKLRELSRVGAKTPLLKRNEAGTSCTHVKVHVRGWRET